MATPVYPCLPSNSYLACSLFALFAPLQIEATPHVLFAGNQAAFACLQVPVAGGHAATCIAVPRFSTTGQVGFVEGPFMERFYE
jgi:hypothetical protein